ncbi:MAG: VCBS repeat-containing protein [Planctomycetaceae bacterium]|nr:VCBS repeat-containing protein [Planctomycetaceae bacterium]
MQRRKPQGIHLGVEECETRCLLSVTVPSLSISTVGLKVRELNQTLQTGDVLAFSGRGDGSVRTLEIRNQGTTPLTLADTITIPDGFQILAPDGTFQTGVVAQPFARTTLAPDDWVQIILAADQPPIDSASSVLTFSTSDPDCPSVELQLQAPERLDIVQDEKLSYGWTYRSAHYFTNYDQDFRYAPHTFQHVETSWEFSGLAPGVYDVWATWSRGTNRATDAPYTVLADGQVKATALVNQRAQPGDDSAHGVDWERIAIVTVNNGALTVKLTNDANDGIVIADAIRLTQQVEFATGARILDEGDVGYSEQGLSWISRSATYYNSYNFDFRYLSSNAALSTAKWQFPDVVPGEYEILATWLPGSNRAPDAEYQFQSHAGVAQSHVVDQRTSPGDFDINGIPWERLGTVSLADFGSIAVSLSNQATSGIVVADAVQIRRVDERLPAMPSVQFLGPAVSSSNPGETVLFNVTNPFSGEIRYRYWLRTPDHGWQIARDLPYTNTYWPWNTSSFAPGEYLIRVDARYPGEDPHALNVRSHTLAGAATFDTTSLSHTVDGAGSVTMADLDGDQDQDLLATSFLGDRLLWYEQTSPGTFVERTIATGVDGALNLFAADLDEDGDMDLVSAAFEADVIQWWENDGDENFAPRTITTSADGARAIFLVDLNEDMHLDVLHVSLYDNILAWHQNDGNGNFTTHLISTSAFGPHSVFAKDVDSDGDIDILTASIYDDRIAWYRNDGSENFTMLTISQTADSARNVLAADFDGDNDIDVASASLLDNTIAWYQNDGSENFTKRIISSNAQQARSLFAADIDNDGDIDLASASIQDDKVAWYENDGHGQFTERAITTSADGAIYVFGGDIDDDGDIDLFSAAYFDDTIRWHRNRLID